MALLEVSDLSVEYETDNGPLRAVDGVDFSVDEGEIIGIVGESGCGKTTFGRSLLGLLPRNGRITSGSIEFDGSELTNFSEKELNEVRWRDISIIVQNAMNALDPVIRIGDQFVEVIRTHSNISKSEARNRTRELLQSVDIDPARMRDYGHELSGGQRQRVIIALALALEPPLVIADEPTTGLDVIVQDAILELISNLQHDLGNSMIFITHDISVIAEVADRVAVMYGGQIAEIGTTSEVFKESGHPYTIGLKNAFPSLSGRDQELVNIPGSPPNLVDPPSGCRFEPRCPFSTEKCQRSPELAKIKEGHAARCHYTDDRKSFRTQGAKHETWESEKHD